MRHFTLWICLTVASLLAHAHNRPAFEYVENKGQWEDQVLYRAPMGRGAVFLEKDRFTFSFVHHQDHLDLHEYLNVPHTFPNGLVMRGHAWNMQFIGAQEAVYTGEGKQTYYYNYFIGNDPSKWASRVGIYTGILYEGLYEGIDLRAHHGGSNFKYDFIVHPGHSPAAVRLRYEGLESVHLVDGKLLLETSIGQFTENRPYAFQVIGGKITEVPCHYVLEDGEVTFAFPNGYNTNYDLVIDPELIAATLSGSVGASNYGHTATFDIAGNIYTGCISFGVGYPTTTGAFQEDYSSGGGWGTDFGLSKLDPEGSDLLWASYLGGGSGDYPHSLWANDFGELYVYGSTSSADFATTAGAYDTSHNGDTDIAVAKFSSDGTTLIGSTYIGGSAGDGNNSASVNYGDNYRGEIILDGNGKVLIASASNSTNFPTTSGAYQSDNAGGQDGVFCRLNSNLTSLEVATYIGSSGNDMAFGLRVNSNGQVYLAGMAGAANFPTTTGAYQTTFLGGAGGWGGNDMDGFIARFNPGATQLQKCTFLATDVMDQCFFIDLDNDENVFVFGQGGPDMPVVGDVYSNPGSYQFVTKLNADLSDVLVGTVVGSGGTGWATTDFVPDAFLVDHCNNIYISSYQANASLETTSDALYATGGFYLAVFTEDLAELEYGTYYTGNHVDGGTSRFDKNGTVYQAVCSGGGFATTTDAWATNQATGWDIGVFKIDFDVSGVNSAITASDVNGCAPYVTTFDNFSTGDQFFWDFGDGTTSTEFEPTHTFTEPGSYDVMMIASDSLSCNLADTSYFTLNISTPVDYMPSFDFTMDCSTMSVTTENTTGYDWLQYIWDMGDGTIIEDTDVIHVYDAPGDYVVTLQAIDNGCDADEEVSETITVFNEVIAIIDEEDLEGCAPYAISFNNTTPGAEYTWDFGDGSAPVTGNNINHTFAEPGQYTVTLIADGVGNCVGSDTTTALVTVIEPAVIDAAFTASQTNECVLMLMETENQSVGDELIYFWTFGDGMSSDEENPQHTYDTPGTYTVTLYITDFVCGTTDEASTTVTLLDQVDLQLPPDVFICYYEDAVELEPVDPGPGATYTWSTGETTPNITVTQSGDYTVEVFFNNCTYSHTVNVGVGEETPHFDEVKFCEGSNEFLYIPYEGGSWYSWCTGESEQGITVEDGGEYCYEYIDTLGCLQQGIIVATVQDYMATLYIPNAFTPNNDQVNDVFTPVGEDISEYTMSVWNRWGEEVFRTESLDWPWDGSYKKQGYFVPDGVYQYHITYKGECMAERVEETGFIVLVR